MCPGNARPDPTIRFEVTPEGKEALEESRRQEIRRGSIEGMHHHLDSRPCQECGSPEHGTGAHTKLEKAFGLDAKWENGSLRFTSTTSPHSPSTNDTGRTVPVRIVRSGVSVDGERVTPANCRVALWRSSADDSEGYTLTLYFGAIPGETRTAIEAACGRPGIQLTVGLASSR